MHFLQFVVFSKKRCEDKKCLLLTLILKQSLEGK